MVDQLGDEELQPAPRILGFAPGRLDESFFEPLPEAELEALQSPR